MCLIGVVFMFGELFVLFCVWMNGCMIGLFVLVRIGVMWLVLLFMICIVGRLCREMMWCVIRVVLLMGWNVMMRFGLSFEVFVMVCSMIMFLVMNCGVIDFDVMMSRC